MTYTHMRTHTHNVCISETVTTIKIMNIPITQNFPVPLCNSSLLPVSDISPWVTSNPLSVTVDMLVFLEFYISRFKLTLFPHFLLYIMVLRFIHIIACIICSFLLLSIIPFYGYTIQWNDKHSNDRHLGCSLGMLRINEHSCKSLYEHMFRIYTVVL